MKTTPIPLLTPIVSSDCYDTVTLVREIRAVCIETRTRKGTAGERVGKYIFGRKFKKTEPCRLNSHGFRKVVIYFYLGSKK